MVSEKRLDLACGDNKPEGFYGIDLNERPAVDCVMDLQQFPWDIESESADEVRCSHYIEHIKHDNVALDLKRIVDKSTTFEEFKKNLDDPSFLKPTEGFIKFFNEVYRILKPGGKAFIIAPYYTSSRSFQDPTHTRGIADQTFLYLNKGWRTIAKIEDSDYKCDFNAVLSYMIEDEMSLKSEEVRKRAFLHDWNSIQDLIVELKKI